MQALIAAGEDVLAVLYTACLPEHLQGTPDAATAPQLADTFATDTASMLQLLFAGAVAPDAVSVRLSTLALRLTLRLLDVAHVADILRQSIDSPQQSRAAAAVGISGDGGVEAAGAAGAWDVQWPLIAELAREVWPVPHHRRVAAQLASYAQETVAADMVSPSSEDLDLTSLPADVISKACMPSGPG